MPVQGGTDVGSTGERFSDRRHDLGAGAALQDIGGSARLKRLRRIHDIRVHREKHDLHILVGLADLTGRLDAVENRHRYVGHHDIRIERASGDDQSATVGNGANHREIRLEQMPETVDHNRVVVGQQHRGGLHGAIGTLASTCVPLPCCDRMDNVPPTILSRSSMLTSPRPRFALMLAGSNPADVVDRQHEFAWTNPSRTDTGRHSGVLPDVSETLLGDAVEAQCYVFRNPGETSSAVNSTGIPNCAEKARHSLLMAARSPRSSRIAG